MTSSYRDQKHLRAIGHKLKPVITVAQKGLTENIRVEIDRALAAHELLKIKLVTADRDTRKALTEQICRSAGASCIQSVGHVILIYRAAADPDPKLSNVLRHRQA